MRHLKAYKIFESGIKGALDFIRQHLTQELDVYNRR